MVSVISHTPRIALLDIDGTIFDETYSLTANEVVFRKACKETEDEGILIGLNSDKPIHSLKLLAHRFRIHGPLVAERGAVMAMNADSSELCFTNKPSKAFGTIRPEVLRLVKQRLGRNVLLGEGDDVASRLWHDQLPHHMTGVSIFINPYRLASFSCWTRVGNGREWVRDQKTIDDMFAIIHNVGSERVLGWAERDVDMNIAYGSIIVHHINSRKSLCVTNLRSWFQNVDITMIGDGAADWLEDPAIYQMAVANAAHEYQRRCDWVATSTHAMGVIQALNFLGSQ